MYVYIYIYIYVYVSWPYVSAAGDHLVTTERLAGYT